MLAGGYSCSIDDGREALSTEFILVGSLPESGLYPAKPWHLGDRQRPLNN